MNVTRDAPATSDDLYEKNTQAIMAKMEVLYTRDFQDDTELEKIFNDPQKKPKQTTSSESSIKVLDLTNLSDDEQVQVKQVNVPQQEVVVTDEHRKAYPSKLPDFDLVLKQINRDKNLVVSGYDFFLVE